jgi:hypothetical protein
MSRWSQAQPSSYDRPLIVALRTNAHFGKPTIYIGLSAAKKNCSFAPTDGSSLRKPSDDRAGRLVASRRCFPAHQPCEYPLRDIIGVHRSRLWYKMRLGARLLRRCPSNALAVGGSLLQGQRVPRRLFEPTTPFGELRSIRDKDDLVATAVFASEPYDCIGSSARSIRDPFTAIRMGRSDEIEVASSSTGSPKMADTPRASMAQRAKFGLLCWIFTTCSVGTFENGHAKTVRSLCSARSTPP